MHFQVGADLFDCEKSMRSHHLFRIIYRPQELRIEARPFSYKVLSMLNILIMLVIIRCSRRSIFFMVIIRTRMPFSKPAIIFGGHPFEPCIVHKMKDMFLCNSIFPRTLFCEACRGDASPISAALTPHHSFPKNQWIFFDLSSLAIGNAPRAASTSNGFFLGSKIFNAPTV